MNVSSVVSLPPSVALGLAKRGFASDDAQSSVDFSPPALETQFTTLSISNSSENVRESTEGDAAFENFKRIQRSAMAAITVQLESQLRALNFVHSDLKVALKLRDEMMRHLFEQKAETRVRKSLPEIPFTFAMKNESKDTVRAQIIYPRNLMGAELGDGGFKVVKKSISVRITLHPSNKADVIVKETTLQRFKTTVADKEIKKSVRIHQELTDTIPPETKIVPVSWIRSYVSKTNCERYEIETDRHCMNLLQAMRMSIVNESDALLLLSEVGETLQTLHDAHFVHQDVKITNILLRKTAQPGRYESFLNDYDHTGRIRIKRKQETYRYWDACATAGIILPNTDIYGLALSAFELLVWNFNVDEAVQMALSQKSAADIFRKIIERSSCISIAASVNSIDDLLQCAETIFKNTISAGSLLSKKRAEARVVEILVREVDNSQKLFAYYESNKEQDVEQIWEGAKFAIPTLSTAQSLADELRAIHESLNISSIRN